MITLSLAEAASHLDRLSERLTASDTPPVATLVDEGKPVLAILPWDYYEALLRLVDVVHDPRVLRAAPPEVRSLALTIAAKHAEALYHSDSALTDFEAFGEDDLFDTAE